MRHISKEDVSVAIKNTLIKINHTLPNPVTQALKQARDEEDKELPKSILNDIVENQEIAGKGVFPLCQDTGMVVVFAEIGRHAQMNFNLEETVNEAVREAYEEGYLRKSIVGHPLERKNTNTNTPAIIHQRLTEGDTLRLKVAAKGGGSENMSSVSMLKPTDGEKGIKSHVIKTIKEAGGKPCPPIIVGIGLGGNLEKSALMAKEAVMRELDDESDDDAIKALEHELLDAINDTDVGPMGVGGKTTCLAVKINTHPTHIASLPVAVNIQCHAARHEVIEL